MKKPRVIDVNEVDACLKIAAYFAVHGTREQKQGRFRPRSSPMKKTRWSDDYGNVVISCGPFKAVRSGIKKWHHVSIWRLHIWRHPGTGKLLHWYWGRS